MGKIRKDDKKPVKKNNWLHSWCWKNFPLNI